MTAKPWVIGSKDNNGSFQRVYSEQTPLTTLYDFNSGNFPVYIGEAVSGHATSESVWRIQKREYTDNKLTSIKWANGDARFNTIWDNRASYIYS